MSSMWCVGRSVARRPIFPAGQLFGLRVRRRTRGRDGAQRDLMASVCGSLVSRLALARPTTIAVSCRGVAGKAKQVRLGSDRVAVDRWLPL